MNLEWLVIGGGIHGVHLAARLLGETTVAPDRLRIVDPGEQLLSRWRSCTATTGMTYLRSPGVHHLDLSPWSLERFAGKRKKRKSRCFTAPYNRPTLDLFNSHCDHVMETFGLADLHIQDRADTCLVDDDGVVVRLSSGQEVRAENLVLAIGAGERPAWPAWAPRDSGCVTHIFQPGFEGPRDVAQRVAVVGGGISACQIALRLLDEGHRVQIVARHDLREHQFDSDSGWLGPKNMARFERETDVDRRREIITEARHRGSVPPEVRREIRRAILHERLGWHEGEVVAFSSDHEGVTLTLTTDAELQVDQVLLATGFAANRPGGAMVDALIDSAALPCAVCGYPVVDSALRWHPRVYVSGPLAELELGPVSRNIAGARRAADRLIASLSQRADDSRKAS